MSVALLAATSGTGFAQVPPPAAPTYVVAEVRSDLAGSAVVGKWRAGLMCLPNGRLRWSEIDPDPRRVAAIAIRALREQGLQADLPVDDRIGGVPPANERTILGDVVAAEANVCARQVGVPRLIKVTRTLKGRGTITVRWRVHRPGEREPLATYLTCAAFAIDGVAEEQDRLLEGGIAATAADLARALGGNAGVTCPVAG